MRVIVGLSGASGVVIGVRLVEELLARSCEVHAVVTSSAWDVLRHEMGADFKFPAGAALYEQKDAKAPFNSSSFRAAAMVVAPCSMKSLSAIAAGYADNILVRAADGMLRTGGKLILVPRETPLSLSALENMASLRRDGALIAPPMAAYYHGPKTVDDMTNFFVGKLLDLLGLENDLYRRWSGGA
ncbi:MAG: UbiX family flavin prenyltransferase [Elusimicrobiota bacterium]